MKLAVNGKDREFIFSMISNAYNSHKEQARFSETQRYWVLAAYFAFTGIIWTGFLKTEHDIAQITFIEQIAIAIHLLAGIIVMISASKLQDIKMIIESVDNKSAIEKPKANNIISMEARSE